MTAEYLLEQRITGPRLQMDITESRYQELAHAREVLSDALAFEQRYELLLGNFISMELAFTEISLRATVEPQFRYPEVAETIRQANRHVVNVLTSIRGYADQVPQDFKCLELEPQFKSVAEAELVKLFERSPDYRLVYELRNHVQHKATAVHGFEDAGTNNDPNGWAEAVKFYASKATLSADKSFKARTLAEQPERIDIRRRARRSLKEMGVTHLALRGVASEQVARARSAFESAIKYYKEGGAESVVGLCARRAGVPDADVQALLDWDDVRLQLVQKSNRPPKLWPSRTHLEPKTEQIVALWNDKEHTQAQAAATVFVSEERWKDYEDGLAMPAGLYLLYQLQVGRHPTHSLPASGAAEGSNGTR